MKLNDFSSIKTVQPFAIFRGSKEIATGQFYEIERDFPGLLNADVKVILIDKNYAMAGAYFIVTVE